ncbi:3-deoxy-D-manno-octulosonic acid transferase [Cellvibrio japonicus]|nr:3-deoxy-D-manno-octulosonic acid transferase [Cellvibrio japonicus]QEI17826.1 3-deoxy-D-manno-octulosonic acid transferase [Cellvibrio japonicus]QEI21401.1 3-deoxy-D-manno-octulosonic acid transferase [Cellvibrio japonicus]
MRFIYTLFFYLLLPVILLRLYWRGRLAPAYRKRWAERFGFFSPLVTHKKVVWIHTVSMGEFLGALPLIRQLLAQPDVQIVVTTTTPTGSERVRAALGDNVFHVYAPYDLPDAITRFLVRIKPALLVIMETELWPNTLAGCAKRHIPAILINARLSEKSARGYRRFSALTRPMLKQLTRAAIQNTADADRFMQLGLPESNLSVTGNIKFDLTLPDELRQQAAALKSILSDQGRRRIWIAASTHLGEDEIILDAFARIRAAPYPWAQSLLLILVPRHPERFDQVAGLCESRGFHLGRRSSTRVDSAMDIFLGDTMGELLLLFGASDLAFVGGSLVARGGHNFIEPAAWGLPLLSGESLFNFAEVSRLLREAGALTVVSSSEALANACVGLLDDVAQMHACGTAALAVAENNRGALQRTLAVIQPFIK